MLFKRKKDTKDSNAADLTKTGIGYARLGQKKEDIIDRYGKPTKETVLASGIESLQFEHGEIRLLVEISLKSKKTIQVYYFKKTPFDGIQVNALLDRNSEGFQWWPTEVFDSTFHYKRTDGGIGRGGKSGDEFMLAVLTGSEVKEDVKSEVDPKKTVQNALNELDGL